MQHPLRNLYLLYHELRPSESRYSYAIDSDTFEKHIDLFVALRKTQSNGLWPEVTFDDGHISNFELAAPILQARGVTAQFFITVGWTGKRPEYMGWPELRSLREAGQTIGAHGWTHTLLTHCSDEELQTELGGARRELEDKLGVPITSMSLPGGRYDRRVLAACEAAGYTEVYTSVPKVETMPLGATIGRMNVRGDMQPEWLAQLLDPESGVLTGVERVYRVKAAAKALLGDRLYEKLWAVVNGKEPDPDGDGDHAE